MTEFKFQAHQDPNQMAEWIKKLPGPILVTGVGGFVGTALFCAIKEVRDDVFGVVSKTCHSWQLDFLKKKYSALNLVRLDLNRAEDLKVFWQGLGPKVVYHLAAYGGRHFQDNFEKMIESNVIATKNILDCAAATQIHSLVIAGSSSEYGFLSNAPNENTLPLPDSLYSVSKNAVTQLSLYYALSKKIPVSILRLYSVYGAFENLDRLVPQMLLQSKKLGRLPPLVDAETSRDFISVADVIMAFFKTALCDQARGEVFNIGTGRMTTIGELSEIVQSLRDGGLEPPDFESYPARAWDRRVWVADPTKAKTVLGWEPRISLNQGLTDMDRWLSQHQDWFASRPITKTLVSVVVACYHDEKALPILARKILSVFDNLPEYQVEIIFVNDGSPFGDREVIRKLEMELPHIKSIHHTRNFGSQAAFLSGMLKSKGEVVILMDGDLQDPPELIPEFLSKIEEGYEVVGGVRTHREGSLLLTSVSQFFYRFLGKHCDFKIPNDVGDFAAMKRHVVDSLLKLHDKNLFWRTQRAWLGYSTTGVEHVRPRRPFGSSTNSWIRLIGWARYAIFLNSRLPVSMLWIFGCLLLTLAIGSILLFPSSNEFAFWLSLASIQFFIGAILGEFLLLIFRQVNQRPHAIYSQTNTPTDFSKDHLPLKAAEEIKHDHP